MEIDVKKIAEVAKLSPSPQEAAALEVHFKKMLKYFQKLQELDLSDVEPLTNPHEFALRFREGHHGDLCHGRVLVDRAELELLKGYPQKAVELLSASLEKTPPKFIASWKSPSEVAPSPKKQTTTWSVPRILSISSARCLALSLRMLYMTTTASTRNSMTPCLL